MPQRGAKGLPTAEELPGHMPHRQASQALTLQTGPVQHSSIPQSMAQWSPGCLAGRHQGLAVRCVQTSPV